MSQYCQQLLFSEDSNQFGQQVTHQYFPLGSPLHKKIKRGSSVETVITNPIELAAMFGGMSHQNSEAQNNSSDGGESKCNYFSDNYERHIYDRTVSYDSSQDGFAVHINASNAPSIFDFLSPDKRDSSARHQRDAEMKVSLEDTLVLYDCMRPEAVHLPTSESLFSRYQVLGDIDKGTFSKVLKVTDKQNPLTVYALKKFKRRFVSFNDRKMMLHEVQMMTKVVNVLGQDGDGSRACGACPYVLQCFLAWQEDSYIHILMELSPNGSLQDLVEKCRAEGSRIPDNCLWKIVHDMAAGLHCIHSCGVVHLDIKPSNVLISSDGTLKIGDFGLAEPVGGLDYDSEGDCRYMALELLNESVRLPSADIFSLGITLYELSLVCDPVVGYFEFPTDGPLWHTLRNGQYTLPSGRPAAFEQLLRSTMAPSAEQRVSAEAILRDLSPEVTSAVQQGGAAAALPLLLSVRPRRALDYTIKMSRSPSFDALNM